MELNSTNIVVFLIFHFGIMIDRRVKEIGGSWTHVKEIANTGLLVSVHHCYDNSANLEVFDVSRKRQVKKIYSFEEVSGGRIIVKFYLMTIIL